MDALTCIMMSAVPISTSGSKVLLSYTCTCRAQMDHTRRVCIVLAEGEDQSNTVAGDCNKLCEQY
jgi:hypothetical protein